MITSSAPQARHDAPVRPPHAALSILAHHARRLLLALGAALAGLGGVGWLGLHLLPSPFPAVAAPTTLPEMVPIPVGLPVPVERFFRQRYGDRVPLIHTAVITGRGTIAPFGLPLPMRFRFIHEAGRDYRHYIETTFFGIPFMRVNEHFVDGKERQELPWMVAENSPRLNQAGNLGLWAESIEWLPAILLTDPRVRWEPIDGSTAFLVVPFGEGEERLLLRFDEATGDLRYWEAMRYQTETSNKSLWINGTWFDQGKPWLVFTEQAVVYNVPVDTSLSARGP